MSESKCSAYDYALVESARTRLRKPNKLICVCVHCRAQATEPESMKHQLTCCFRLAREIERYKKGGLAIE